MATPEQAQELIRARNSAASFCTRILTLTGDMPIGSARADLGAAQALTHTLAGVPADDGEFVAMSALLDAAAHLQAVVQAHGQTILAPTNWLTETPALDAVLKEMGV
jgi:hypothetical protein